MSKPRNPNQALRYQRELRNWTQEQAAEALLFEFGPSQRGEVSAKTISKWESGVQIPSLEYRVKLCRLYGVSSPEELGFLKREKVADVQVVSQGTPSLSTPLASSHPFVEQQEQSWLMLGTSYLGQLFDEGWSVNEILDTVKIVLQGVEGMSGTMRQNLLVARTHAIIHNIPSLTNKHVSQEELAQLHYALSESIGAGWKLFHAASNAQVLAVGQALLTLIRHNHTYLTSRFRAMYYSSVYNLLGVALYFQEQYQSALDMHMNAHIAALATGDALCVVQSLTCQANTYQALGRYNEALQTIEEALRTLGDLPDVKYVQAKAHLLACVADYSMKVEDYTTVQKQLEASEVFLVQISPNEEFDATSWHLLAGNFALATRNHLRAISCFEKALSLPQTSNLRYASASIALAAAYLFTDNSASLTIVEQNALVIETVNAPLVNKQLVDYIQQGLLVTSPGNKRVKTFIADMQHRIPSLKRYIVTLQ